MLGCLLEKERTVPDQYPLTSNTLQSACNQSTSREPVMHLGEHEVTGALGSLKAAGLLRFVHPSHGRSVTRYRQVLDERLELDRPAAALVAVLLLRGAQTAAELHSRTERLHTFGSFTDVEYQLGVLAGRGLVERLERQPGQKELRWKQLIADEAVIEHVPGSHGASSSGATGSVMADRIADLEARVARLEAALADLL